jgi:hypothetical protein
MNADERGQNLNPTADKTLINADEAVGKEQKATS